MTNATRDSRLRLLLIGTLPPPVGGAGVSLGHLSKALAARSDVQLLMVNTGGVRGHPFAGLLRFCKIASRIVLAGRRVDVISLQPVPSGLPFIGPFAWLSSRLWRKPFIIRMFGGQDFLAVRGIRGAMVRFLVRSTDLYLAQTKALVKSAQGDGLRRVEWYPTSRPMADECPAPEMGAACRKFVYLGHVKPLKGIHELLAASERLTGDISVDVYGPLMDGLTESAFDGIQRVKYRGEVPPGSADALLSAYDAVVLPTYWPGEGYPGIILEAYGAGLPMIATHWKALPEIVDDSCGILIEPKDADALCSAMQRLADDPDLYHRLRMGVRRRRSLFNSARWVDRFVELCHEVVTQFHSRRRGSV